MYEVYLKYMQLPVAPGKIDMKIKNQNRTIQLINEGEVNLLKNPGLTDISFTALIPAYRYPFAVYPDGFREQAYFVEYFEMLKQRRIPFQFIVVRHRPNERELLDTNIRVSLEEYSIDEDSKEGFDLLINVQLKQYKPFATKRVRVEGDRMEAEEERIAETAPDAKTYVTAADDQLWTISKRLLGYGPRYTEIYDLNKRQIDAANEGRGVSKYTIRPGMTLVLPENAKVG